jgi:hypothetical protein
VTIELIQLKQEPLDGGKVLGIDLLFEIDGECYWRHIEMDDEVTMLNGAAVAPWKELLYVVNKELKAVERLHFEKSSAETRKLSLEVIHPDLYATIDRFEQMVKA